MICNWSGWIGLNITETLSHLSHTCSGRSSLSLSSAQALCSAILLLYIRILFLLVLCFVRRLLLFLRLFFRTFILEWIWRVTRGCRSDYAQFYTSAVLRVTTVGSNMWATAVSRILNMRKISCAEETACCPKGNMQLIGTCDEWTNMNYNFGDKTYMDVQAAAFDHSWIRLAGFMESVVSAVFIRRSDVVRTIDILFAECGGGSWRCSCFDTSKTIIKFNYWSLSICQLGRQAHATGAFSKFNEISQLDFTRMIAAFFQSHQSFCTKQTNGRCTSP